MQDTVYFGKSLEDMVVLLQSNLVVPYSSVRGESVSILLHFSSLSSSNQVELMYKILLLNR